MSAFTHPIDLDQVRRAAERLDGVAHRTPVLSSRTLDDHTGASVVLKAENLQRVGAFKFRGAYTALAALEPHARTAGVVAFSSGNHAQAVALAGRLLETPATIVMPSDAPASKLAATRGYGAEVVEIDRARDDREAIARELSESRGLTVIPPFDHPAVMAGQGTAALELIESDGPLDCLVVPVGGGGLMAGCATAAKGLLPDIRDRSGSSRRRATTPADPWPPGASSTAGCPTRSPTACRRPGPASSRSTSSAGWWTRSSWCPTPRSSRPWSSCSSA